MTNYNQDRSRTDKRNNNKIVILSLISIMILGSNVAVADGVTAIENKTKSTVSYENFSNRLTNAARTEMISIKRTANISDEDSNKATGLTREEVIQSKIQKSSKEGISNLVETREFSTNFSIYNVVSSLYDDFDADGYYQTFSIIFDADVYSYTNNQVAEVYALFYISEDGGPWTHYYTTDNFLIEGDYEDDKYEVITTFLEGYDPKQYDILIDLYQAGYSEIVASISSDDINALYALPLESNDYDQVYVEVIEVVHGGSLSILSLCLLSLLFIFRHTNVFCLQNKV